MRGQETGAENGGVEIDVCVRDDNGTAEGVGESEEGFVRDGCGGIARFNGGDAVGVLAWRWRGAGRFAKDDVAREEVEIGVAGAHERELGLARGRVAWEGG